MLHNPRVYRYEAKPLSGEYWSFYNNSGYIEGVGFNAPSFYPVSYTHLDVYKRQAEACWPL